MCVCRVTKDGMYIVIKIYMNVLHLTVTGDGEFPVQKTACVWNVGQRVRRAREGGLSV